MVRRIAGLSGWKLRPAQVLGLGYLIVILGGGLLLQMPASCQPGVQLSFLDAVFMATSATCVTGLSVLDVATSFSTFGQLVIMLLIQIGGLGIMTISTLFALLLGKRIGLRHRLAIQEELNTITLSGVVRLIRLVLGLSLGLEILGAGFLFIRWMGKMPIGQALYFAVFHSVSAFNNAGFVILGPNLEAYVGDVLVNIVLSLLVIAGGLGFLVIGELLLKSLLLRSSFRRLSLHSKLVLVTTSLLMASSFVFVFCVEGNNPLTLGPLEGETKLLATWFQSVSPRTAGFSTIPVDGMRAATLFLFIFLMFIGASPGSTGGGIKTTTAACLVMTVISTIKGQSDTVVFGRRIPETTVRKALSIVILALVLVLTVTLVMLVIEDLPVLDVIFEVVSAFSTTGLSTGITPLLSSSSKLLLIILMFVGRIGPVTLALALGRKFHGFPGSGVRYPEGTVIVG